MYTYRENGRFSFLSGWTHAKYVCAKVNKNQLLLPLRMMVLYIIIGQYPKNTSLDFFPEHRVEVIRLFVIDKKNAPKKNCIQIVSIIVFFFILSVYTRVYRIDK